MVIPAVAEKSKAEIMPTHSIEDSNSRRGDAIEFRELEAFVAVAESGSFTTAAQLLFLSQPTVSARIATLEAALDAKLLDRNPGMAQPTPAGEVLLPRAKALLRDRDSAMQAVIAFLGRLTGILEIGASSIPGSYLLPRVLSKLRSQHPELRVNLRVADTDQTLEALRRGQVEIAVVGSAVSENGLEQKTVGEDEIVLVATPGLAAAFDASCGDLSERLQKLPLVLREAGSGTRAAALAALERIGVNIDLLHVPLEIGGNSALRETALGGLGAAFLSRLCVEAELASGRLRVLDVFTAPVRRPLTLVTNSGRTLSPAARELKRLLTEFHQGVVAKTRQG